MELTSKSITNQPRKIATAAGVLYILGIIAGILSISYVIDDPEYLVKAASDTHGVLVTAFFHLLMAPIYVGVAIVQYPVLRKYNQLLAFGFAGFRIMAGVFIVIGVIVLLLLLSLSQEFVNAGRPGGSYFQTMGVLLQTGRDLLNHVATIISVCIGGLMYYSLLFQTKLVPRWLSGWGLLGTTLAIAASLLFLFRVIGIITPIYLALNVPMALQEIVLAVWLIVKGFNSSVMVPDRARGN
ncbi:MAG: DUF4386 domain-containing protein [Spirochaetes bacterium]|nr:MAG: DUF4386 domain-containing protein [Spirochaetota bacterium]